MTNTLQETQDNFLADNHRKVLEVETFTTHLQSLVALSPPLNLCLPRGRQGYG